MPTRRASRRIGLGDEQGQTLILGAFFLAACLVLLAVVTYVGAAYTQRRDLQNVADAAALAGAQELNGTAAGGAAATAAAIVWAAKNNADLDAAPEVTIGDGYTSVFVRVRRTSGFAFPTFGLIDAQITAKAKAKIRAAILLGPGVVPITVSETTLNAQTGGLVTLKETGGNGANGNYGLISIQGAGPGANITCEFLKGGSTVGITDPGTESKPGNVSSLHNCLPDRMAAAKLNNCYTLAQVLDASGKLRDECNPLIGALRNGQGIQPTSVIVIPIMTDASFNACSGRCALDIARAGIGAEPRKFAFFHIDATTVEEVGSVGPTCNKTGQCLITGTFIANYNAAVYAGGQPVGDYNANTAAKVVQLVE